MRKISANILALLIISLPASALADVSDYIGRDANSSVCPKVIVIRPEISDKNVFVHLDPSDLQSASNMIGSAVANKYDGAKVIASNEINQYRACSSPVLLTKLKSYTTEPAIFGQHEGKANVSVLHFNSLASDAPDKQTDVSASGERQWGDSVPFMNAIKAVCEKIQKTWLP